jgi:Autophagy-related protein 101
LKKEDGRRGSQKGRRKCVGSSGRWTLRSPLHGQRAVIRNIIFGEDANTKIIPERAKVRKAMETMLLKTAMKIVSTVNREKEHIPPITTSETNPFPYQININPKGDGWGARMGIF